LPALYTPFLKQDARKIIEQTDVSELVNRSVIESE